MSLTSMLKMPPVRAVFREAFPMDRPPLEGELLAPPVSDRGSQIGAAADYLLRFHLEREFAPSIAGAWVAEEAVACLRDGAIECDKGVLSEAESRLASARAAHRRCMETGVEGDEIIRASFDLAQIDAFYRTGRAYNFVDATTNDIRDLRGMLEVAERRLAKPQRSCYLNPGFGDASNLVGGADADLIIDDVLIDIKTARVLSLKRDMYNQLAGYYVLSRLGRINGEHEVELEAVGVYFARYGILHTVPADRLRPAIEGGFLDAFEKTALALFHK